MKRIIYAILFTVLSSQAMAQMNQNPQKLATPSGFNWSTSYPIAISTVGPSYTASFPIEKYAQTALTATPYYVDVTNGNDTNNGSTWALAFKSIYKCNVAGNADAQAGIKCLVKPGTYYRSNSILGASSTGFPLKPVAYVCDGTATTPCVVTTADSLTWGADATFTNTYSASRTNVDKVLNLTSTTANGDYAEMLYVATATLANTTPNSWSQVSGTVYVHRTGEEAVTNTNTRALLGNVDVIRNTATPVSHYFGGTKPTSAWQLEGGRYGVLHSTGTFSGNIVGRNVKFSYSGGKVSTMANSAGFGNNGVKIDNMTGLFACINCNANANSNDGFNYHNTNGQLYAITINSVGKDNGREGWVSNNGLTGHENVVSIDINGDYDGDYGGNVHFIGTSKLWGVGTKSYNSMGDTTLTGGGTNPAQFKTQDSAKMWLDGVMALQTPGAGGTPATLNAQDTSAIYTRNAMLSGTATNAAGATITTY